MKRTLLTAIITLTIIAIANRERNLPRMTEITLAEPVFAIGIDSGGGDSVIMSLIYERIEDADSGENGGAKLVESAEDSSAAAAFEALKRKFSREIAVSTADYFLIGEAAARENLRKYTDYLSRNNNLKLTASIFIVRGSAKQAAEILTETKSLDILRNFGQNSGVNGYSAPMFFYETLSKLEHDITPCAFAVPALEIVGGEVVVNGYAIISDGQLVGFLDNEISRGYNIIRGHPVYSVVEIAQKGIAVRLESARCKVQFNFAGDELAEIIVRVNLRISSIDRGTHAKEDLNTPESIAEIERIAEQVILSELRAVIAASKLHDCDFLNLGDVLRLKHPYKWEQLKDNWQEIYAETPVRIVVDSRLTKP
ncbi:MAG: hypothetical protein FWH20_01800 [Oscillospiraceae bacterium]|nr:hypothetical protein [Oscillospiraceae bacterium]